MEWQPLESEMFASAAYDAQSQTLYLRFRSGDVYRYFGFPEAQYPDFLNADSRGRYFLKYIRDSFRHERLAKLRTA